MVPLQLQLLVNFITLYINHNIGYFKVIIIILQQVVKLIFQCVFCNCLICQTNSPKDLQLYNDTKSRTA